MASFAVDLHIHSCLSPCADDDMTPNNILGMAHLKGLDAVAITDHNAWQNLPAAAKVAEQYGIVLLPGLEVTTREEVHMLCYFKGLEEAAAFGEVVQKTLFLPNNKALFGNQLILDENDAFLGEIEPLLIQASSFGVEELLPLARGFGGLCVPAHINKKANSMISNLGFLPLNRPYAAVEVFKKMPLQADTGDYLLLNSSDAHQLGDISEREFYLRFEEKSLESLFAYLSAHVHESPGFF
ncbi:MAG: PHP domain-containing protein [Christensenellaceae bacterium]|jgi:PHP family Zn ribbon phosphoesterase|nr:PHP domain-containing protein [Christensenellaceae bacterium]